MSPFTAHCYGIIRQTFKLNNNLKSNYTENVVYILYYFNILVHTHLKCKKQTNKKTRFHLSLCIFNINLKIMKGHVLQSQFYTFIYAGKNQSAVYFVFSFMNKK